MGGLDNVFFLGDIFFLKVVIHFFFVSQVCSESVRFSIGKQFFWVWVWRPFFLWGKSRLLLLPVLHVTHFIDWSHFLCLNSTGPGWAKRWEPPVEVEWACKGGRYDRGRWHVREDVAGSSNPSLRRDSFILHELDCRMSRLGFIEAGKTVFQ